MVLGGTVEVDGRLANKKSKEQASSRSLRASTKVGYLSLMMWSKEMRGLPVFSNRAASPASPLPRDLAIFFARALWSRNLLRMGS